MEKDYLKENVLKVRKIHNKLRNQQPIRRDIPMKVYRQNEEKFTKPISENVQKNGHLLNSYKQKSSFGKSSGHSDYFSLTTAASANDVNIGRYKTPNDLITSLSQRYIKPTEKNISDRNAMQYLPMEQPLKHRSKSFTNFSTNRETESKIGTNEFHDYLSNRTCKSILCKIKTQKPSCEVSTNHLWTTVKIDHRALSKPIDHCNRQNRFENKKTFVDQQKVHSPHTVLKHTVGLNKANVINNNCKKFNSTSNLSVPHIDQVDLRNLTISSKDSQKPKGSPEICSSSGSLSAVRSVGSSPSSITLAFSCSDAEQDRPLELDQAEQNDPRQLVVEFAEDREVTSMKPSSSLCSLSDIGLRNDQNNVSVPKTEKNSVQTRQLYKAYEAKLNRSKSSNNLQPKSNPPSTYRLGEVPRYLLARKAKIRKELREKSLIDPKCPPGHAPLSEEERKNTLDLLMKGHGDVISQISRLPLGQDTLRVRKFRIELESKLNHIEEGIHIFSQPKVYVLNDT